MKEPPGASAVPVGDDADSRGDGEGDLFRCPKEGSGATVAEASTPKLLPRGPTATMYHHCNGDGGSDDGKKLRTLLLPLGHWLSNGQIAEAGHCSHHREGVVSVCALHLPVGRRLSLFQACTGVGHMCTYTSG